MQTHSVRFGYDRPLVPLARNLRKHSTLGEVKLWQHLKGKQRNGYAFHRQKPLDQFIVDFWCPSLALAIEIDGCSTHDSKQNQDLSRQQGLESKGIHFLRFQEKEVQENLEGCLSYIDQWILQHQTAITYQVKAGRQNIPSIKRGGARAPGCVALYSTKQI